MVKLGRGAFGWGSSERVSDRYGAVSLFDPQTYPSTNVVLFEPIAHQGLEGKRVRLVAHVVVTRTSGHLGDIFLGIYPSTPEVGEEIDLGVGILHLDDGVLSLVPGDPPSRPVFWMDPKKLYRLHDQIVDLFAEETEDECSPLPDWATKGHT